MSDRPILFSGPMVRALLDDRKTQTRRVLKPQPPADMGLVGIYAPKLTAVFGYETPDADHRIALRYMPGDRLYVREAWRSAAPLDDTPPREMDDLLVPPVRYEADGEVVNWREWRGHDAGRLRAAMHMPRWASRLTLTVTDLCVQRLQEINEADARAEGCPVTWDGKPYDPPPPEVDSWQGYGRYSFCLLWQEINGKRPGCSWADNPWVVAISFTVERRNIDGATS